MTLPNFTVRRSAIVLSLCSGLAVLGCAGELTQMGQSRSVASTPSTATKPARVAPKSKPVKAVASSTTKAAPMTRSAVTMSKREDIALSVFYLERIMVPAGSELTLRANGDGSGAPSVKSTKVKSGPPYSVSMPVDTGEGAYPMTVQATLTSTIGHVLSGSVTLTEKPTGPVEIVMRTKSE
ncbi:hypothetical protein O4H61_05010 [Roseovarius aestuarii]|nr:hypothetical protein [Roseovarius aestuarii]